MQKDGKIKFFGDEERKISNNLTKVLIGISVKYTGKRVGSS